MRINAELLPIFGDPNFSHKRHDPRKLVEHYRQLQQRHRERLAAQPPQRPTTKGENAA